MGMVDVVKEEEEEEEQELGQKQENRRVTHAMATLKRCKMDGVRGQCSYRVSDSQRGREREREVHN